MKHPQIIYGTAWKKERTTSLVKQAVGFGFRAIDTANQPKHYDEPRTGEALRSLEAKGMKRSELFLQTKFTPIDGHDSRVPYDPALPIRAQVHQSFQSSLEHLGTDYLDSYLLHGPYSFPGLGDEDWEAWGAFEELASSGKVHAIGISNVNVEQLTQLVQGAKLPPQVVQNRCYAIRGWDRAVREVCKSKSIAYQGFSLLTANPDVLNHPRIGQIATRLGRTAEQVIYRFSMQAGMVPLTGTTNETHMKEALSSLEFELSAEEIALIERISI